MGKVLTEKQIERYRDDGFIAPIRVMSQDKALKVKERVEEAEKAFPDEFNPENRNNLHLTFMVLDEMAHNPIKNAKKALKSSGRTPVSSCL